MIPNHDRGQGPNQDRRSAGDPAVVIAAVPDPAPVPGIADVLAGIATDMGEAAAADMAEAAAEGMAEAVDTAAAVAVAEDSAVADDDDQDPPLPVVDDDMMATEITRPNPKSWASSILVLDRGRKRCRMFLGAMVISRR